MDTESAAARDPGAGRPVTRARPILVIEDNAMDLDLLLRAFEEHAVLNPVRVCRDGEEALNYIDAHPSPDDPDLPLVALLDLRLPKVDGIEAARTMANTSRSLSQGATVSTSSGSSSTVILAQRIESSPGTSI